MAASTSTLSAAELLDQLDRLQLRDDVDWRVPSASPPDAPGLIRQFVKSGWLTPYQANQLILGRGQDLRLGGYVLLEKIGEGGMGTVFAARHLLMRRTVALKLIRGELLAYPNARLRFLREVELLARLSHPHIVTAHDAEESGDRLFLVMEYCEGSSLAALVRDRGPLPIGMACACIQQAALGLQHAMEHGLVHRDIKPGNLLVTPGGLKVLDLGLARLRQTAVEGGSALTDAGTFLGTPDFVAPEQSRNPLAADIRSDLYSLGCTLYFALSGTVPFPGGTPMEKVLRHQSEEPATPQKLRPEVPGEVIAIVRRLMAKQPGDRYQTPRELTEVLKPWAKWDATLFQPPTGSCVPTALPTLAPSTRVVPSGSFPASETVATPTVAAPTVAALPSRRPHRRRWLIAGGLVALIACILVFLPGMFRPASPAVVPVEPPEKWHMIRELRQPAFVNHVAFSPDGNTLAVTYWPTGGKLDHQILLWDVTQGKETDRLELAPAPAIGAIAFSPDGKYFATGAGDLNRDLQGKVILWDARTWERRYAFIGGSHGILALTFSADSKWLAVGDRTGQVTVWDITGGEPERPIKQLLGHTDAVNAILFLPDGQTLATASGDRTVRLWNLGSKKGEPLSPDRLPGYVFGLALSPTDPRMLVCVTQTPTGDAPTDDDSLGAIHLWDLESRQLKRPPIRDPYRMFCVTFSPDGKYLIVGKMNACTVVDVRTGESVRQLEKALNYVTGLALTRDGSLLAVGMQDEQLVRLWRLR